MAKAARIGWRIGWLWAGLLAGCGGPIGPDGEGIAGDGVARATGGVGSNVFVITGATCGVVINPDSQHTAQLQYLMDASGCKAVKQPTSHQWIFSNVSSYWQVKNPHSGMCMTAWGAQGGAVVQTFCTTGHEALWVLDPSPTGGQHMRNVHTGLCLNISGGPYGRDMIQWRCGNAADKFYNEDFFIKHAL